MTVYLTADDPSLAPTSREREAQPVASGAMKMPEEEMDWKRFFGHPQTAPVSDETAVHAAIDSD